MRRLIGRLAGTDHRHLLQGSAVLVVGAAVQAVGGGLFWLIAARSQSADDVGVSTALFTSVLFVSYATGLGLTVAVARYAAGRDRDSHTVFGWAIAATTLAAGLGAAIYVTLIDAEATATIRDEGLLGWVVFAALVIGSSFSLIVDVRWMTQRKWSYVLARITITGLIRFPLLLLVPDSSIGWWLFIFAMTPTSVSGLIGVLTLPRVTGARHRLRPRPSTARSAVRYSLVNYASTLAYQAPSFALPVIVLVHVDSDVNASFYVAWGITAIAFYVPMAIGQALLAEGGKQGSSLAGQVRLALTLAVGLLTIATAGAWLIRDIVVSVYGEEYREAGEILPMLVGAGIPWAITSVYLTEARVRHQHAATVLITLVLSLGVLVPALILVPSDGLDGAAVSYLIGNLLAAAVAAASHFVGRNRPVPPDIVDPDFLDALTPTDLAASTAN